MDRFDVCWPYTLRQECPVPEDWSNSRNFSNDAHDPGAETMCGVTQKEYTLWREHGGLPSRNVRFITRVEGEAIYRGSYWLPWCPKLPVGVDMVFFDESVNSGPHAAIVLLQRCLGISADGLWGPQTANAVSRISRADQFVRAYTVARIIHYEGLNGFKWFGKGWLARAHAIGNVAAKMAAP